MFYAGIGTDPVYTARSPIAEDPLRSADGVVRPGSELSTEACDLLDALQRFAATLVHSPNDQQAERLLPVNLDHLQEVTLKCGCPMTNSPDLDVMDSNTSGEIWISDGKGGYIWLPEPFDYMDPGMY